MDFSVQKMSRQSILLCVIFTMISGCSTDKKPEMPFQKAIDTQNNDLQPLVQFLATDFIVHDIQSLKDNNIALNTAQNRITQSRAFYKQAYAGYLPQISGGFSANRQRFVNPITFQPEEEITLYSLSGDISLVPDLFGRTQLRTQIANNQVLSNYFQAQTTYLETLNNYARNYHLICATKSLININQDMVLLNEKLQRSTKLRYELGRANVTDFYNAQDAFKASQIAVSQSKQNYNLAKQGYYTLIGETLDQQPNKVLADKSFDKHYPDICKTGFPDLPSNSVEIPLNILDQRPDIKVAHYNVSIANDNLDLSLKAFYPDTELLFSFQNRTTELSNLIDPSLIAKNLIASIGQLIYDGGVRDAQINISEADLTLAKQTYANTLIAASNDVITLGKNLVIAITLEDKADQRMQLAKKGLDAANRNYKFGNISFRQLLETQGNYYASQIALVEIKQNVRNLYTDLLTASGIAPIRYVSL